MSGRDGAGRWGPTKRNEGGRPERGYAVNGGDTRRRDDRNYGYRDDGYYGRGYEQRSRGGDVGHEQSRPREEHRARRDDQRHDQRSRYPNDRKDRGQWSRYSDEGEWQCMECGISNYDTDERCARCGTDHRDRRSMSNADESEQPPPGPKWPPPFESGGAAYDFHAASGMFYESIADFYYDPKSKLYFGNKSKQYYTYRPEEDPPFCALDAPPTLNETAVTSDTVLKPESKKKIAISLKTTVLPGEAKASKKQKPHKAPKKVKAPPPEPKKKDAVNIEIWAERGKEIREETAPAKMPPVTTTNKPVCLLCRRKFATVEKLKKHEELSSLHKENLEKKRKEEEVKKKKEEESGMDYRDRAHERRIMHGPAEAASLPALPRDLEEAATTRAAEVVRPEENLGESNIGNVLLQKLGWKSGTSIGRGANGDQDNALVKDWEKIESLAASGQQGYSKQKSRESGIGN